MHRTFKSNFVFNLPGQERQSLQNSTYFMHLNSNKFFPKGLVNVFLYGIFGTSSKGCRHPVNEHRKSRSILGLYRALILRPDTEYPVFKTPDIKFSKGSDPDIGGFSYWISGFPLSGFGNPKFELSISSFQPISGQP